MNAEKLPEQPPRDYPITLRQNRSFSVQGVHFYQSVFGATVVRERDPVVLKRAREQRPCKPQERKITRE